MSLLAGRRVLITGASSGIGAAAAVAFAQAGAEVALVARARSPLEAVATQVRSHGTRVHVLQADLADRPALEAAVAAAANVMGGLDVLVLNAAAMVFGPFSEIAPDAFDRTLAVTFTGAVDAVRAALPHLEASSGAIVAVGSIAARIPLSGFGSYAAAKHALRGFLGSLRVELLERGSAVTVSMVHPGGVATPLWRGVTSATGRRPRTPPDLYSPETVARALVLVAARPRAEFTVGLLARAPVWLHHLAPRLADRALALVGRYTASGREPSASPGGLWASEAVGRPAARRRGRRSLWAGLRLGP